MSGLNVQVLSDFWLALAVHLWQSSLVLLPLFVLSRLLRSAPARLIQLFWGLALLKLLLPLSFCGRLLDALIGSGWLGGAGHRTEATLLAVSPVLDPRGRIAEAMPGHDLALATFLLALTLLWGLGVAWSLLRLTRDLRQGRGEMQGPARGLGRTRRAKLDAALAGTPLDIASLRFTSSRGLPRVAGLLRPRILVPVRILDSLDVGELRAVLLHEDGHRRRRDPLRAVLLRLGAAPLFFYPPVWALLRRFRQAAEFACDEGVLAAGVSAGVYARALARSVDACLFPRPLTISSSLGGDSLLRRRLERLTPTGSARPMRKHGIVLLAAGLLLALGSFLPLHSSAEAPDLAEFDTPPVPLKTLPPEYPEEARKAKVEGSVVMRLQIDPEGLVEDSVPLEAVEGHPEFVEAVRAVLPVWRFKPAEKDGEPVRCHIVLPFKFELDDHESGGAHDSGEKQVK